MSEHRRLGEFDEMLGRAAASADQPSRHRRTDAYEALAYWVGMHDEPATLRRPGRQLFAGCWAEGSAARRSAIESIRRLTVALRHGLVEEIVRPRRAWRAIPDR